MDGKLSTSAFQTCSYNADRSNPALKKWGKPAVQKCTQVYHMWPNLNLTLRRSVTRRPLVHQGRHPRLCASASEQASHHQSSWRDTRVGCWTRSALRPCRLGCWHLAQPRIQCTAGKPGP
eukprot:350148-Chlamydomonas_euryale.AAC.1